MKHLKFWGLLYGIIIFVAVGCEKQESDFPYGTCIKGEITGIEQCYGNVLIQIEAYNVGNKAAVSKYNELGHIVEHIEYDNIIKTPSIGFLEGLIYFVAGAYNIDMDDVFIGPCPHNIIPHNVPIVILTHYSQTQCP
ncbi:MAG: hypothetical protein RBR10_12600 [Bacteroidales bacterium]|jgi:hypothetical protein|nr:hypothetical protein [Bacteroidales bacterium]MDY0370671.1 hypothetical protein [Bacteroidales bacterium]